MSASAAPSAATADQAADAAAAAAAAASAAASAAAAAAAAASAAAKAASAAAMVSRVAEPRLPLPPSRSPARPPPPTAPAPPAPPAPPEAPAVASRDATALHRAARLGDAVQIDALARQHPAAAAAAAAVRDARGNLALHVAAIVSAPPTAIFALLEAAGGVEHGRRQLRARNLAGRTPLEAALHARSRFKRASREYGIANATVGAMRRGASERAVVAASTRPPPPTREGRGEWVGFAR